MNTELYETRTGRVIIDADLSHKMYQIYNAHPESNNENSSGYEWSEMGMANLLVCFMKKKQGIARNIKAGTPIMKEPGGRTKGQF